MAFESLSKRSVDGPTLAALISAAFGPETGIAAAKEINEGFFNAAFRVTLTDGREVVLKASPEPRIPLLTYERDIMRGEAEFFRAAADGGVLVPEVLCANFEREVIDGDFIVMSAVDGVTWYSVEQRLDEGAKAELKRQLGGIAAQLHRVTHPRGRFGYPAVDELSGSTWPEAFAAMIGAVLDDADRFNAPLPLPSSQVRKAAARHADALAAIKAPALVHFDLWPGNVMITGHEAADGDATGNANAAASRISGLIDGERMIWGDPLMEFVGMAVFGRADQDEHVRAGYLAAGGAIDDGEAAERRMTLYHLYMQVLLLTEMGPRGYTDPEYLKHFGQECPKRIFEAVNKLS
ncbi:aminoglycoside phosphotransferase family protein [Actinocrinis sp.]|uniref:phosphotransferase family protein n=1 Tax=Actinocrinis sp. TaxID=1920516 RepID=UPI002D691EAE|nr:aminoglycoside phosphotransferase family protein [Actinocrinis sp.]HZP50216.1 aminoglycoside phosphotransferase family protein [Actinocrinis sp.]